MRERSREASTLHRLSKAKFIKMKKDIFLHKEKDKFLHKEKDKKVIVFRIKGNDTQ